LVDATFSRLSAHPCRRCSRSSAIIGLLDPLNNLEQMKALADRRVTAVAFELQGATDILAATKEHATA
jgi:hypothetical protein